LALGLTSVGFAQQVGIVAQPCPPPATLTPNARQLLSDLFMEPRSLTAADFGRLMNDADFKKFDRVSKGG
jgi:hypothetical protein